jgi:hypothetical protein
MIRTGLVEQQVSNRVVMILFLLPLSFLCDHGLNTQPTDFILQLLAHQWLHQGGLSCAPANEADFSGHFTVCCSNVVFWLLQSFVS